MKSAVWPVSLTVIRLLLGPAMVLFAAVDPEPGAWLVVAVIVGFLTDFFDGVIARRLGVATPALRRFDSQTDLVFWLCVLGSVFIARWDVARANWGYVLAMIVLEALTYFVSIYKFGRETCTHAYSAKAWCVLAVGVCVALLAFNAGGVWFRILLAGYFLSWIDVVAIVLILPVWQNDVPSSYHALLLRRARPGAQRSLSS